MAAPPALKLKTICSVTSDGNFDTPKLAVTPWFPAKITTWGASNFSFTVPDQLAYQIAKFSRSPSAPGGFVN